MPLLDKTKADCDSKANMLCVFVQRTPNEIVCGPVAFYIILGTESCSPSNCEIPSLFCFDTQRCITVPMDQGRLQDWSTNLAEANCGTTVGLVSPIQLATLCSKGAIIGAIPAPVAYLAPIVHYHNQHGNPHVQQAFRVCSLPSSVTVFTHEGGSKDHTDTSTCSGTPSRSLCSIKNPLPSRALPRNLSLDSCMSSLSKQLPPGFFRATPLESSSGYNNHDEKAGASQTPTSKVLCSASPLKGPQVSRVSDGECRSVDGDLGKEAMVGNVKIGSSSSPITDQTLFKSESKEKIDLLSLKAEDPLEVFRAQSDDGEAVAVARDSKKRVSKHARMSSQDDALDCSDLLADDFELPSDNDFGPLFLEEYTNCGDEQDAPNRGSDDGVHEEEHNMMPLAKQLSGDLYELYEQLAAEDSEEGCFYHPNTIPTDKAVREPRGCVSKGCAAMARIEDHMVKCISSDKNDTNGIVFTGTPIHPSTVLNLTDKSSPSDISAQHRFGLDKEHWDRTLASRAGYDASRVTAEHKGSPYSRRPSRLVRCFVGRELEKSRSKKVERGGKHLMKTAVKEAPAGGKGEDDASCQGKASPSGRSKRKRGGRSTPGCNEESRKKKRNGAKHQKKHKVMNNPAVVTFESTIWFPFPMLKEDEKPAIEDDASGGDQVTDEDGGYATSQVDIAPESGDAGEMDPADVATPQIQDGQPEEGAKANTEQEEKQGTKEVEMQASETHKNSMLCHFMMGKTLTQTDVSRLGRIILPRGAVEKALPKLNDPRGRCMKIWHRNGKKSFLLLLLKRKRRCYAEIV